MQWYFYYLTSSTRLAGSWHGVAFVGTVVLTSTTGARLAIATSHTYYVQYDNKYIVPLASSRIWPS
jgi:hypothetical protein